MSTPAKTKASATSGTTTSASCVFSVIFDGRSLDAFAMDSSELPRNRSMTPASVMIQPSFAMTWMQSSAMKVIKATVFLRSKTGASRANAAAAEREDGQAGVAVLQRERRPHHRAGAVVDLPSSPGRVTITRPPHAASFAKTGDPVDLSGSHSRPEHVQPPPSESVTSC